MVSMLWDSDMPEPAAKCSMDVLMAWLATPGNYARWKRAGAQAVVHETRKSMCQEIVAALHAAGLTHRTANGVSTKIRDVERSFWEAVAWRRDALEPATAAAVPAVDIDKETLRRCPLYHTLAPLLLGDEASVDQDVHAVPKPPRDTLRARSSHQKWSADAVASGKSSLDVLLDWLAAPTNYARWCAESTRKNRRVPVTTTKDRLLKDILAEMKRHGLAERSAQDVRAKIKEIEHAVLAAVAWRDRYGPQILAAHGALDRKAGLASIRRGMARVCTHFERIGAAMLPLLCGSGAISPEATMDDVILPALTKPTPTRNQIRTPSRTHSKESDSARMQAARDDGESNGSEEARRGALDEEGRDEDVVVVEEEGDEEERLQVEDVEEQEEQLQASARAPRGPRVCEQDKRKQDDEVQGQEEYRLVRRVSSRPPGVYDGAGRSQPRVHPVHGRRQSQQQQEDDSQIHIGSGNELRVRVRLRPCRPKSVTTVEAQLSNVKSATRGARAVTAVDANAIKPGTFTVRTAVAKTATTASRPPLSAHFQAVAAMAAVAVSRVSFGRDKRRADHEVLANEQPARKRSATPQQEQQQQQPARDRPAPPQPQEQEQSARERSPPPQQHHQQRQEQPAWERSESPQQPQQPRQPQQQQWPMQELSTSPPPPQQQHSQVAVLTVSTPAGPTSDALQRQLEMDRVRHEQRCLALRDEQLQLEVMRKQIQITKAKTFARHELRLAGVPDEDIEHAFPLP